MANRGFKPVFTNGNGKRIVTCQVLPAGAGTPTLAENDDKCVASVARTGAGTIEVTLTDTYLALSSVQVTPQLDTPAACIVVVTGATTVATTKKITLTTFLETAGEFAAADIDADADNILHLTLVLRDSSGQ